MHPDTRLSYVNSSGEGAEGQLGTPKSFFKGVKQSECFCNLTYFRFFLEIRAQSRNVDEKAQRSGKPLKLGRL